MPDNPPPGPEFVSNLLNQIQIFLARPSVQIQLLAIAIIIAIGFVADWIVRRQIRQRFPRPAHGRFDWRPAIRLSVFPILTQILIFLIAPILFTQGYVVGWLLVFSSIVWLWLVYRLILGVLYVLFPNASVRRFQNRFLGPLFGVLVFLRILGHLTDLEALAATIIATISQSPITLGALFVASVGLYFWIDGVWGLKYILYHTVTRFTGVNPGVLEAGLTLASYFLVIAGVIVAISSLGLDTTTVAAITGGLSVGVGFGLREVLANFISGIILLFEQSIRPGDVMEINDERVTVDKLGIRSTLVHTQDNVEIVVPNEDILTSSVKTFTKTNNLIRWMIPVGVSYDSDPDEIKEALLAVADRHLEVQKVPAPVVFFDGFGASSLDFNLGVWVNPIRVRPVSSDLRYMIWKEFAARNIEIPFPQRDLHIRSGILPESATESQSKPDNNGNGVDDDDGRGSSWR